MKIFFAVVPIFVGLVTHATILDIIIFMVSTGALVAASEFTKKKIEDEVYE